MKNRDSRLFQDQYLHKHIHSLKVTPDDAMEVHVECDNIMYKRVGDPIRPIEWRRLVSRIEIEHLLQCNRRHLQQMMVETNQVDIPSREYSQDLLENHSIITVGIKVDNKIGPS